MTSSELDDLELTKALELVDTEIAEAETNESTELAVSTKDEISIDDITKVALDSYRDIQTHSEQIYDAFYGNVATRVDRSDSSKQMLVESQRIKIESINALANLANAKAKMIAAQAKAAGGSKMGVIINTKTSDDVGINLANLVD